MEHCVSTLSVTMNGFFSLSLLVLLLHIKTSLLLEQLTADAVHLYYFLTSMFHQFIQAVPLWDHILNGFDAVVTSANKCMTNS